MNSSLPQELREIEDLLSGFTPSAISEQVSDKLVASMEVEHGDHDEAGLEELEKHLEDISPSIMRTDVLSRMVKAMDTWYEQVPEDEKVISFGAEETTAPAPSTKRSGGMIAAAAAVAILGGVTALVLPRLSDEVTTDPVVGFSDDPIPAENIHLSGDIEPRDAWLVPNAASHKVVHTSERGLVMTPDNMPHRCIQLNSMETIELEDESGRQIKIERPNVKLLLIPVEAN